MSPEQTRGEALDQRTDLWSMGVLLYEMLAGVRPFGGEGEALIHAIRHEHPSSLSAARAAIPPALTDLVERCLQKDPKERPDSAEVVAAGIRSAATVGAPTPGQQVGTAWAHLRWVRIAALILLPAAVLVGLLVQRGGDVSTLADDDVVDPGIAVLPFEVRGDDFAVFRAGMVDLLSINLDGVAGMRAIDSRTVIARWEEALQKGGTLNLERSLDIARSTGARYAVIGGIVSSGPGMRLTARIHSLEDGRSFTPLQVEGPADSLFALVDRLSIDILAALWQGRERPHQEVDLSRITTTSLPALKYFLEGENLLRRADFEGAAAAYERAIAADSTFAFALFHLGLAAGWIGYQIRHDRAYEGALRHVARLPEREALLLEATLAAHARAINLGDEIGQLLEISKQILVKMYHIFFQFMNKLMM
jgi:serine/threonine-protein kinase